MGKKLPWVLAGIFGAFVVIVAVKLIFFASPTDPVLTLGRGMLTIQSPQHPLSLVIGAAPSADGDAADDYKAAMDAYAANKPRIEGMLRQRGEIIRGEYRLTDADLAVLRQVADHMAAGAAKKTMSFYVRHADKEIRRPYYPAEADRFQELLDVEMLLAVHNIFQVGQAGYAQAEKHLFDAFSMGQHMIDERARLTIVMRGVGIQEAACDRLANLYSRWQKPAERANAGKYMDGLAKMASAYGKLEAVIWGLDQPWNAPHPGDVFNMVARHRDRAVRVEATIVLGIIKHGRIRRGDRRYVRKLIDAQLASPDSIEAAAGRAADSMTMDDIRAMNQEYREL